MTSIEMEETGYDHTEYVPKHVAESIAKSKPRCCNKLCQIVVVMGFVNVIVVGLLVAFGDFRRYSSPDIGQTSSFASLQRAESPAEAQGYTWTGPQSMADGLAGKAGNQILHIGMRQDPLMQDCLSGGMKQTFPDIDYSFYGYNILKGYPLADGRDPGFTRPLFAFNFSSGGHTADCRYALPKGLTAAPDVACRTSFTSRTVSNSHELKESLNVNAKVSGGGWGVSFSASTGYKQASSTVSKGESKIIQSTASCKYYFSKLNRMDMPDFSSEMIVWLKRMETSFYRAIAIDDNLVYEFVDYFGTHIPITMVYGARFTYQSHISSSSYESLESSDLSVDVQASYSGLFSLGGGFGMSESQQDAAKNFAEKTETSTLSVGAPPPYNGDAMTWASTVKDTPVPVQYELVPIYELFDQNYKMHQYFDEQETRQIRDKIMNIASSYCRKSSDLGLDVQCNDDSLIKFKSVTLRNSYNHINETLNRALNPCIEECEKRSYCLIISWFSNGQCHLGHDGTYYDRNIDSCKDCQTFFNPQGLNYPIMLKHFRYDSSVTRRNKLSVPRKNITFFDLRGFCSLHCSEDDNCIGFEVSNSTVYKYNCATYSQHSEDLVTTARYDFETNVIGDFAKRKVKERYSHAKAWFNLPRASFVKLPSGVEEIEQCDKQCCENLCRDNLNCNAAIHISKAKQVCYNVLDQFQDPLVITTTIVSSPLKLIVFVERASSGWFNISGFAADTPTSVPVNNSDACADKCALNIKCDYAFWKSLTRKCFNHIPGIPESNYESDAESMVMFPNHKERIRRFKLAN